MTGIGFLVCAFAQFVQTVYCFSKAQTWLALLMFLYGLTNLILYKMHMEGSV